MNWNLTCKIGLKVLAAAIAGVAIFIGIDRATKQQQQPQGEQSQQQPENMAVIDQQQQQPKSDVVVSGLRGAQDTCHKLFDVTQSLTTLAESLGRLFNKNTQQSQYNQPYYRDPWCNNYNGSGGSDNIRWQRISPFIVQATPVNPIYNTGNYPY